MKPVVITQPQWLDIRSKLKEEYPLSIFLLRDRMKQKLGFTPRDHRHYDSSKGYYVEQVHLDFYSENKKTMFLMKFSEVLSGSSKT
jgi:hypothetical protein